MFYDSSVYGKRDGFNWALVLVLLVGLVICVAFFANLRQSETPQSITSTSTPQFLYATPLSTTTKDLVCVFDAGETRIVVPCVTGTRK